MRRVAKLAAALAEQNYVLLDTLNALQATKQRRGGFFGR